MKSNVLFLVFDEVYVFVYYSKYIGVKWILKQYSIKYTTVAMLTIYRKIYLIKTDRERERKFYNFTVGFTSCFFYCFCFLLIISDTCTQDTHIQNIICLMLIMKFAQLKLHMNYLSLSNVKRTYND